ncbi:MAG: quinate 5-dehydrogenase [Firmicutes bacterium]|nr:quinate 5-dehydrogenase [Bacillota bacterium]
MKRVVSVSLGSSKRNHAVETEFLGEKFRIERIGTDGDMDKAIALIRELDGKVDAFGMGGIDLYIYSGEKRYVLRDARRIAQAARLTPIVDGSGLKNTLEQKVIEYLVANEIIPLKDRKVLMVCGVDRPGMARALVAAGSRVTFGDLIFGLGIPVPITSLRSLERVARVLAPLVSQIPFKYLYPTGQKQEEIVPKHSKYYHEAEIIAGDFHFVRRYMPANMQGKIVITNTVTSEDIEMLRQRGVSKLITTTPDLDGRSFGTNVMEGVLVSLAGKAVDQITPSDYGALLDQIGIKPRIVQLS